jgi:hypothetical protein
MSAPAGIVPERKSAAAQGFGAGFGQTMAGQWKSSVTDLRNPHPPASWIGRQFDSIEPEISVRRVSRS